MVAADVSTKKQQFARDDGWRLAHNSTKLNLVGPIDLLESERGPSIEVKSQLKRTKVIHVRCLDQCMSKVITRPPKFVLPPKREVTRPVVPCRSSSSSQSQIHTTGHYAIRPCSFVNTDSDECALYLF